MTDRSQRRASARIRLALSYAVFLVAAGAILLFGVYVVLRYVPNYPLTAANSNDADKPIATRGEILDAVVSVGGYILAALAVLGMTGGWILAECVLRPLNRINEAARIAATGRLDFRINLTGRNDAFQQVADSFDHMLDRLQAAFAAHERFAANASHELRTPLTVTKTLLDVARRDLGGQDYPELIHRLSITNARAIGLTEALLRLADVQDISAVAMPVDLASIVQSAAAEHAEEAAQSGVSVMLELEPVLTMGDAALLRQMASNLIQNAIRHNAREGHAHVTTRHDGRAGTVSFTIENTGAVYTVDQASQLSEPFLRGSGRIRQAGRGTKGYGLGLALVSRIIEVHNGELSIVPRPSGGLIVTATLFDTISIRQRGAVSSRQAGGVRLATAGRTRQHSNAPSDPAVRR